MSADQEASHTIDAIQRIGRVIDGKYKIRSIIGVGGMGIVYEAEHQFVGRLVALKILKARYADRFDEFQRFLGEARMIGNIGHRAIVEIHDAGAADGTTPYIVMEKLVGENLEQRIRRKTQLSPWRSFRILFEVLKGLEAAHTKRVIHCDIKPANIFLVGGHTGAGAVKILDFGISRMVTPHESSSPSDGPVFGTPYYMAPEQVANLSVDARTDLYAVGAVLYECLSGHRPHQGTSRDEVFAKILKDNPPPLQVPGLSPLLERVVMGLLARKPSERPSSAAEVMEAIEASQILTPPVA